MRELGFHFQVLMRLNCDNKVAISIVHDSIQHDRTKHIEVDRHFIKEKLQAKQICIPFVKKEDQLVDVFTKGLCSPSFSRIVGKLSMHNIYIPVWGGELMFMGIY